jgi:hypothetical protein
MPILWPYGDCFEQTMQPQEAISPKKRQSGQCQREHSVNRAFFFLIYVAGIIAIWVGGNPWWRIKFLLHDFSQPGNTFSIGFVISLFASVALIKLAVIRGRSIGRPRLFLLPLLAILFVPLFDLLFSSIQLLNNWLLGITAWRLHSPDLLRRPFTLILGYLPVYAYFIPHLTCCAIGTLASHRQLGSSPQANKPMRAAPSADTI